MEDNKSILDSASRDASAFASPNPNQAVKKKRNPPGNPDPNAEVIALSPNTLLATNRFVCEICSKGFQRDQNLQLHRRGHNLPWKLKQRSSKEVRKKVYICPEVGCVHHDPSRALGDLTGIKKHFSRKHGEKKWKCDKCQKKYAVHSDWKAHSKTCGTREYRCDCGTPFSRRDSFITHRAFCDVLAEESTRVNFIVGSASSSHGITQIQFPFSSISAHNEAFGDLQTRQELNLSPETLTHLNLLPSLFPPPSLLSPQAFPSSPHMSATALLQKAAEMASKTSGGDGSLVGFSPGNQNPNSMGFGGEGENRRGAPAPSFGDGTTRDFLGLRVLARGDFLSMAGFAPCMSSSSSYEQLPQSKKPWTG